MSSADHNVTDKHPDVSIIMSAYNDGRWLAETLDAMLAQTHTDFEVLVIDDASTDDTPTVLAGYHDSRIRVIRHAERNGWMNNMNKLAAMARGDLLKFHCPDDVMLPTNLERAVGHFRAHPELGYLFSDYVFVDERGGRIAERPVRRFDEIISGPAADAIALSEGCFANTSCLFVPRDKYLAAGGMRDVTRHNPLRWPTVEDYELMVRLQEHHPAGYIPSQLVAVRAHQAQVQANKEAQLLSLEGAIFVYKALVARGSRRNPAEARRIERDMRYKLARDHFQIAVRTALRHDYRHAWRMFSILRSASSLPPLAAAWGRTSLLPALGRRLHRIIPHPMPPQRGAAKK